MQLGDLYYESRGSGPPLIFVCGGPTDADVYAPIAQQLADRYTTVTYDPRGNSRSVFTGPQVMDVHGDDLAALIDKIGGPAFVFGNSGGGQIAMNAFGRHRAKIRALIAHEPPCITLLPDGDEVMAGMRHANELGATDVMAGFMAFMKLTGIASPASPGGAASPHGDAGSIDMTPPPGRKQETSERMRANLTYFVREGLIPIASFRPDPAVLRDAPFALGVGAESVGELAHRTGLALAEAVGVAPVLFPGGHGGYSRYVEAFADAIHGTLRTISE